MLNELLEYAKYHGVLNTPGYELKSIQYIMILSEDGEKFFNIAPVPKKHYKRKCPHSNVSKIGPTLRSHFLIDGLNTTCLLFDEKNPGSAKDTAKHAYYLDSLKRGGGVFENLAKHLSDPPTLECIHQELRALKAKASDKMTFQFGLDQPEILDQEWWTEWWMTTEFPYREAEGAKTPKKPKPSKQYICMGTGENIGKDFIRLHAKVPFPGCGPTKGSLISFDKPPTQNFGFEQGENAPLSKEIGENIQGALSHIIQNMPRIDDVVVAYYYSKDIGVDILDTVMNGDIFSSLFSEDELKELDTQALNQKITNTLNAIKLGIRPEHQDAEYTMFGMQGVAGRIQIRWMRHGKITKLIDNARNWLESIAFNLKKYPKFYSVVNAAFVRNGDKTKIPRAYIHSLWDCAINGNQIPRSIMNNVMKNVIRGMVRSLDTDPGTGFHWWENNTRLGMVHSYLKKEGISMASTPDFDCQEQAYHYGRLFCTQVKLADLAIGKGAAAKLVSNYRTASMTPMKLFPRTWAMTQIHLTKLGDKPKLKFWYSIKMGEITTKLDTANLPNKFNMEQQMLFALGYAHQEEYLFRKQEKPTETKEGETTNDAN